MQSTEDLINKILLQQPVDLDALYALSRLEGGFLNNRIRTRVWPKLLNVNRYNIPDYRVFVGPHRDTAQVGCDIDRSLWNFKHTKEWESSLRDKRRSALSNIILSILCRHPNLHYYQGYHDVVSVFLLVLEEDHLAFALAQVVSINYLSDFMRPDFETVSKTMRLLMTLLRVADKKLYKFLRSADLEPFFATSWLITWFSHDVKTLEESARIFDAMICSHPLFCLYLCTTLVIHYREQIFKCERDFASLHNFIVHIPDKRGIAFEDLLPIADELMALVPPRKLQSLANAELKELISQKKVKLFFAPKMSRFVDSDWTLLRNRRLAPMGPSASMGRKWSTSTSSSGDSSARSFSWGWRMTFTPKREIEPASPVSPQTQEHSTPMGPGSGSGVGSNGTGRGTNEVTTAQQVQQAQQLLRLDANVRQCDDIKRRVDEAREGSPFVQRLRQASSSSSSFSSSSPSYSSTLGATDEGNESDGGGESDDEWDGAADRVRGGDGNGLPLVGRHPTQSTLGSGSRPHTPTKANRDDGNDIDGVGAEGDSFSASTKVQAKAGSGAGAGVGAESAGQWPRSGSGARSDVGGREGAGLRRNLFSSSLYANNDQDLDASVADEWASADGRKHGHGNGKGHEALSLKDLTIAQKVVYTFWALAVIGGVLSCGSATLLNLHR